MKKKLLTLLLMCTLSINFTACGNTSKNSAEPEPPKTENEGSSDTGEETKPENTDEGEPQETGDAKAETETQPDGTNPAEAVNENQPEEAPETIYEIGNSAALKDWEISVTNSQIVESITAGYITFSPNEEGNRLIQVSVTATNNGKQADNFLPSFGMADDVNAKVLYSDGYEFSATRLLGYDNDLHDSTINPLSSQTGEIVFEIPSTVADSQEELLLQFSSGNETLKFKIR